MKKTTGILLPILVLAACNQNTQNPAQVTNVTSTAIISRDTANMMVSSYLSSINVAANDTDVRSFFIDAAPIKALFDSAAIGASVKQLKIFLAHTPQYIHGGGQNINCGYRKNGITLVITGVDLAGNYVYLPDQTAVNRSTSCPSNCPTGTSGNNLLILNTTLQ
ncbi:hypothetical protein [Pedobacter sp. UBA4863]|uniref:hypothetical protein n=1 Tax=Pedobacter sp. UBA4863 TaxID=1947060 RepID=UPI0025CFE9C5|nr:hypothetical protein [Pedobacter sp. UBA4863]